MAACCPLGNSSLPSPAFRPRNSPSNRRRSVGRSDFTTNYFVLREGQKERRSWERWGGAEGIAEWLATYGALTLGLPGWGGWLGGLRRPGPPAPSDARPHLPRLQPQPTLSLLPVCSSASSPAPVSSSPPLSPQPSALHSPVASLGCDLVQEPLPGSPGWTHWPHRLRDKCRGVRFTYMARLHTWAPPRPQPQRGSQRPACVAHMQAPGFK